MDWTESLKRSINYMEEHLLEDVTAREVAEHVYMSSFYFQKGFKIVTGYSISEYIRYRRLYMAALELASSDEKVIDMAYKYGYDTPESFTKAFSRFHGIAPSQIKGDAGKIKPFLPLTIQITIQGGTEMNYTIEKMDAFKIIGFDKAFTYDSAFAEIPKFWTDFNSKYHSSQFESEVQNCIEKNCVGEFGVCIDQDVESGEFIYAIAGIYNGGNVPDQMKTFDIPALEWAKFKCVGPMPGAIQAVNTYIFKEWLPGNPDFEIATGLNLEWYSMGDINSADYESAIWIPVKRK